MPSQYRETSSVKTHYNEKRQEQGAQIIIKIMNLLKNMYSKKPGEEKVNIRPDSLEIKLDNIVFSFLEFYKASLLERADFFYHFNILKKNYKKQKLIFSSNSNLIVRESLDDISEFLVDYSKIFFKKRTQENYYNPEVGNNINIFKLLFNRIFYKIKVFSLLFTSFLKKFNFFKYVIVKNKPVNSIFTEFLQKKFMNIYINNFKKGKLQGLIHYFSLEDLYRLRSNLYYKIPYYIPFFKKISPNLMYQGPSSYLLNYRELDPSAEIFEIICLSSGFSYVIFKESAYIRCVNDFYIFNNYNSNVKAVNSILVIIRNNYSK
jgi:hypothetical protein